MNEKTDGWKKSVNGVIKNKAVWLLIILVTNGTKENEQIIPHVAPLEMQGRAHMLKS